MKIVNLSRGSGKSSMLIHTAYATGYPILVIDNAHAEQILRQAGQLKDGITVYTIEEWLRYKELHRKYPRVLLDEAEEFIERALESVLQASVVACTASIPCVDMTVKATADDMTVKVIADEK